MSEEQEKRGQAEDQDPWDGPDIAVVGMAGRFPGADDPEELWRLLENGEESIADLEKETSTKSGIDPQLLEHPDYIPRKGLLRDVAGFDAAFFGFNPREARLMDPQQRLFLQSCRHGLDHAGIDPATYAGRIGVFAGTNLSTYQMHNLMSNPGATAGTSALQVQIGNDKDYLATSAAFKLNLTGPSLTVQTACSTSLSAVHLACQSLLDEGCDAAIAGGVSVVLPAPLGYIYQRDGILSPDGHCRPFDAEAAGTVFSDGVAVVVLKRLADAVADGDTVLAVIRGTAMNNDGAGKVGFTAPAVEGQAQVVAEALDVAGVEPHEVSYVECHGTGTKMGDPIEVTALDRAFRGRDPQAEPCWIGSIKGNVGHLRMASGVTGLIKVVQMLRRRQIAPTLHYQSPNPELRLDSRPFRVADRAIPWEVDGPRIAGVSSFGMGGTNVHVVLEEAPELPAGDDDRPWQVLPLSARTDTALDTAGEQLAIAVGAPDFEGSVADVAHTLQVGRRALAERRALVVRDLKDAAAALRDPSRRLDRTAHALERPVVFLFPGQGTQRAGSGADLYRHEPVFRAEVDRCCELLKPELGPDLRTLLYPEADAADTADERLKETALTQPAVFVTSWAMAQLWKSWGLEPEAMIGHSLGEYVAATLAGVFSLESALSLVAERGRLLQSLPGGVMSALPLTVAEVEPILKDHDEVSIAAINGERAVVISGPESAVDALEKDLRQTYEAGQELDIRRLRTSHAFHSSMVEPILETFRKRVAGAAPSAPERSFVSNVTGTWITSEQARDPQYWTDHVRRPVLFADGLATLLEEPSRVYLEVGPGRTLSGLARRSAPADAALVATLGDRKTPGDLKIQSETGHEMRQTQEAVARLWLAGVEVDWSKIRGDRRRRKPPLPGYPFEPQTYWVQPGRALSADGWVDAETIVAPIESPGLAESGESESRRGPKNPPRNALERALAEVWCDALGLSQIDVHDDFFELGGHSLLATELAAKVRQELGRETTVQQIYDAPTVAGLAELLRGDAGADEPRGPKAVERRTDGLLPASPAQERMAFFDRLEPGNPVYNLFVPQRVRGDIDVDRLARAVDSLVERHESLRTVFIYQGDDLVARIGGERAQLIVTNGDTDLRQRVEQEMGHAFDLANGPLLRAVLCPLDDGNHALLFTVHHIIADQLSVDLLLRDLKAFYDGEGDSLPELELQYADFAADETGAGHELEPQVEYWQKRLADLEPCLELATDRPRPAERSFEGGHARFELDTAATEALLALAKAEKVSPFAAVLAALKVVLHRWSLADDIAVGAPFARRETPASRPVVGPFFNPVVLRTDLGGNPTFRALLERVRSTVTGAHAHQDVPIERLVEILAPERDPSFNPLFQVMVSYLEAGPSEGDQVDQNDGGDGLAMEPLDLAEVGVEGGRTHFDLFWVIQEQHSEDGRRLVGSLGFARDLFDGLSAQALTEHFRAVLTAAVERPDASLSELRSVVPVQKLRVAVSASFTSEPIEEPLAWMLRRQGLPSRVEPTPYAQVFQQLLDPDSAVATNTDGFSVFLLRLEDWGAGESDQRKARRRIEQETDRFIAMLTDLRRRRALSGLVVICPMSEKSSSEAAMARFLRAQKRALTERLAAVPGFSALDGEAVIQKWRVDRALDAHTDALGHLPYTESYFAALAGEITEEICRSLAETVDLPTGSEAVSPTVSPTGPATGSDGAECPDHDSKKSLQA